MKGLTLTQPWASLVAIGAKKIETRSWSTSYRGLVAIHAAKSFPKWAREMCLESPILDTLADYIAWDGHAPPTIYLPTGAIVAVATLVACESTEWLRLNPTIHGRLTDQEREFGDYAANRYGFVLFNVRRLPDPIPYRGTLGLWNVPPNIIRHIDVQLPGIIHPLSMEV